MTPEQKAFQAALKERLAERGRNLQATEQLVLSQFTALRGDVTQLLAALPSDFNQWRLPQILAQLDAVLQGATGRAAGAADAGIRTAWQQGEDFIDKPLAAAGINVEATLPLLDATVLAQLRSFVSLRLKDVGAEATTAISRQLSLVTIGGQSPFDAIKAVNVILDTESPRRATTIVRTEVSRAFAMASDQRLTQAAAKVPGLQKQWRRSGKLHSRANHDAADGQVVDAGKPFVLQTSNGPIELMYPHDPAAPPSETINCGCLALPFKASWKVSTPGAKPFTDLEKALDPRKARSAAAIKPNAFDIAKAGGAHGGFYRERTQWGKVQIEKSIRNIGKVVQEHKGWIANPTSKVADWQQRDARYQDGLLAKWRKDIKRQTEHIEILQGLLSEREKKNG